MKKLTTQDWSLIARYLKEEASQTDIVRVNMLMDNHPGLKEEILTMNRSFSEPEDHSCAFDSEKALQKLHERLRQDNLI